MATLDEIARQQGYKGYGAGQGNAAFEKAAAESLANAIQKSSGQNYTPMQVAGAVRAGDTNIPYMAGTGKLPIADQTEEYKKLLEEAKQQRINSAVAGLQNRYNQTVSDIGAKRNQLAPTYEAKMSQANVGSQMQAKNFAEFLANRGLSRGGTSQQAELMRQMNLQNQLSGLGKQKQEEEMYYNKLESDARRALESDIAQAKAEAEASALDRFLGYKAQQDTLKAQQDFTREQNKKADELRQLQITGERYRQDEQKRADAEEAFVKTLPMFSNDYQAKINEVKTDNDTTNDWQISYLESARKNKLADMLQNEIKTIGQYGKDYQAEINKRMQSEDTIDDRLIPYLKMAQAEKISSMNQAKLSQQEKDIKNAYDMWSKIGYATPEIASVLGIPAGTSTASFRKDMEQLSQGQARIGLDQQRIGLDQQKIGLDQQRINLQSARDSQKTETERKSPYFNEKLKVIENYVNDLSKYYDEKQNEWLPIEGTGRPDKVRITGTPEHKNVIFRILNSGLTDTEQELIFDMLNIPR